MTFTADLLKLRCKSPEIGFHQSIVVKGCRVKTSDDAGGLRWGRSARLVLLSSLLNLHCLEISAVGRFSVMSG